VTINASNIAVCQEALYLLRQDVDLPTAATAATDDSLEWRKSQIAFATAIAEVWAAHDWAVTATTATNADTTNWTQAMRSALAYAIARELAIPLAGRAEDLKLWLSLAAQKLAQARVEELEKERKAVTDALTRDLLALLVPRFDPTDGHLPRSIKTITDRASALADGVRHVVLSVHPWNFAKAEDPTPSCKIPHGCDPYAFASEVPAGCARLLAVYTHGGRLDDWKVFGTCVAAREPVVKAVYIRDDKRPDKWPSAIRRLYLYRLAADTAQTEVPNLVELLEQKYAAALRDAKAEDARESSTPKDAWGRNHYVDAMHGIRPDGPHLPRHSFHGLV